MEKNRNTKIIAIAALLVAIVGLSVGFAAFSNTLTISSSASVTPSDSTFNVDFSSSKTSVVTNAITPTVSSTDVTATNATIDNSASPKITNLSAKFTEPGQSATYTFYAYNAGEYDAYLKSIVYSAVSGSDTKTCTAGTNTTQSLVDAACDDITVSVKVGSESAVTGSKTDFTGHSLTKSTGEEIVVTIAYTSGGDRADGDFTVKFGDITLTYSSAS